MIAIGMELMMDPLENVIIMANVVALLNTMGENVILVLLDITKLGLNVYAHVSKSGYFIT